jgi:hypothetical protein
MTDKQAPGKVFSPQKRTSSTSKIEISSLFLLFFVGHFSSPGSGSGSSRPNPMRIHADPDPKHCLYLISCKPTKVIYVDYRAKKKIIFICDKMR